MGILLRVPLPGKQVDEHGGGPLPLLLHLEIEFVRSALAAA